MSKTKEELLKQFKKSNQTYKLKLAQKAGFKSIEDYLFNLTLRAPKINKPKPTINIVNILDASGSMDIGNKIGAANESVQSDIRLVNKGGKVNYTYTLVSFSDNYDIQYHNVLATPPVSISYIRTRGMTALNQAIGETLTKLSMLVKDGDKTIVTILTDGGENHSSGYWSRSKGGDERVKELIKSLEPKGFTVTFIGTEVDTQTAIRSYGLDYSNTVTYDGTGAGLGQTVSLRSESLATYSSKVAKGEDVSRGFYKKKVQL